MRLRGLLLNRPSDRRDVVAAACASAVMFTGAFVVPAFGLPGYVFEGFLLVPSLVLMLLYTRGPLRRPPKRPRQRG